jgi:hypothetical protein
MTNRAKNTKELKLSIFLKVLAVVITSLGGAIGSYHAARSTARQQADVGYETLASNMEKMRLTVEYLKENENRLWELVVKQPANLEKSFNKSVTLEQSDFPSLPDLTPVPKTLNDALMQSK